jgi:antitoxin ParD1/3/4
VKISLTPKLEEMVRDKVASGLYSDESEVIREALRLMHEQGGLRRFKLDRLREELAKGEADISAGRFVELDGEEEIEAFFGSSTFQVESAEG